MRVEPGVLYLYRSKSAIQICRVDGSVLSVWSMKPIAGLKGQIQDNQMEIGSVPISSCAY